MLAKFAANNRYLFSALVPTIVGWAFTALAMFMMENYGLALFVATPVFMGACSTVLYGRHKPSRLNFYIGLAAVTVGLYCVGLLVFAMEGAICIIMAAPLGLVLAFLGVLIGVAILNYKKDSSLSIIIAFCITIPAMMSFESLSKEDEEVFSVKTAVVIDRKPGVVWKQVVTFSKIGEPVEWFFKMGLAYPTDAVIKKRGDSLIRYCNFSTGCFVEPITTWDEPNLLAFSVEETPMPLTELSPYNIEPAHLHGYFVSKKGQFKLTMLPNGKTLLEGTTWYTHKIKPSFYWRWWSSYIIHKIHDRVLRHIKKQAEQ